MKQIERMTLDELWEEGKKIEAEIGTSVLKLRSIYEMMSLQVRRNPGMTSQAYSVIAKAGKRFTEMVAVSIKRAAGLDRNLMATKLAAESREKEEQARFDRKAKRAEAQGMPNVSEPYDLLYGPDIQPKANELSGLFGARAEVDDVYGEEV